MTASAGINIIYAGLVFGVGFAILSAWMTRQTFFERYVGETTAGSLGAIRMLVCFILLVSAVWEDLPSTALLPAEMIRPSGIIRLLHSLPLGFSTLTRNAVFLFWFEKATIVFLFWGMIGWRTRITVPLGGLGYLILAGLMRQYAWFYHTGLVPLYVILILSFTPCGDGWSLDRLFKIWRGGAVQDKDQHSAVYGWSRFACWLAVAVPYFEAGLSKIRNGGLLWWTANNMRAILYGDCLSPMQFDWDMG